MIWCNADQFATKYDLKGFFTGMIITDFNDADYCGIPTASLQQINDSNKLLVRALIDSFDSDKKIMCDKIRDIYKSPDNPIIHYNKDNFYKL